MRLDIRSQCPGVRREEVERRLRFSLARFCNRIERVTVRVSRLDRVCGDLTVQCWIVIRLVPFGRVSVEVAAVDVDNALNWAVSRIGPAVERELMRWRGRRCSVAR